VIERWPDIVGEGIARNAWPARIARDGTLHVNTADSVWAFELTQRATEIASRLELPAVRFAPGPLAGSAEPERRPPPPEPSVDEERAAAAIAATIQDPNLRKTVQRAVSLSLAREPVDRPV
jgi:Dna[CI] antecedent, DciA